MAGYGITARTLLTVIAMCVLVGCGAHTALITPQAAKKPFASRGFRLLANIASHHPREVVEEDAITKAAPSDQPPVAGLTVYRTTSDARRACTHAREFCVPPVYRVRNVVMAPDRVWSTPAIRTRLLAALETLGTLVRLR